MAEPMLTADPAATAAAQPPDLMAHTRARMAELAQDEAKSYAERKLRSFVKSYVPKVFHPLIPGEGGSVVTNAKNAVSKWFWGLVTSAVITLIFFAVFGVAIVGIGLYVAYVVMTSM
jgi:hypothetical protein